MPQVSRDDLIWIADAAKVYERSRRWLDDQVAAGKLQYAEIEGDRKVYLLRSELDALFSPQVKRVETDSQAG